MTVAPDTAELRKARGAFFTPSEICRYVVDWAIRDGEEEVLEPSCGEAAFLLAAAQRLDHLGAPRKPQLCGAELHDWSADEAGRLVGATGRLGDIFKGDFFTSAPEARFDVVIGNPPYIRYQDFSGEPRERSQAAATAAGVSMSNLASSWAAFAIHSALFLRPGGRLGLVLPAELLTVNYAAEVRRFLLERFARVRMVAFTERIFPEAQEEVVLLLAEGYGEKPSGVCELVQYRNAAALSQAQPAVHLWTPQPIDGKWSASLLDPGALAAYSTVKGAWFTDLETWGDTSLGMVTGNNRYFTMSPGEADRLGLPPRERRAISPAGSKHLRGLTLTPRALGILGRAGAPTVLFRPGDKPSGAALAYIAQGEADGVDEAYKCAIRKPRWWRVPLVKPADLLLTYMNADAPRLCQNVARVRHLNSVHGVFLKDEHKKLGAHLLPLASLCSVTLLGGEIVGRSYGGGMLKLEPREADRLPVLTPEAMRDAENDLENVRTRVQNLTRAGRLLAASRIIDDVLLVRHLAMAESDVQIIRNEHRRLLARRMARSKS